MEDNRSEKSKDGEFSGGDKFFGQMKAAGVADENFIKEIVEMFLEEGKENLVNLNQAFDHKDVRKIKLYAHKLKSSFLMFEMNEAHDYAVKLEQIDEKNLAELVPSLKALEEKCEEDFKFLRKKYFGDGSK